VNNRINDCAPEALVTPVKHHRLPRRDCPLRFPESDTALPFIKYCYGTLLKWLLVADASMAFKSMCSRGTRNPV
jgi:hypothetical protein